MASFKMTIAASDAPYVPSSRYGITSFNATTSTLTSMSFSSAPDALYTMLLKRQYAIKPGTVVSDVAPVRRYTYYKVDVDGNT